MEQQFWDYNTKRFFYCLKDERAYLKGTRDNLLVGKDTTYWVYQVLRCNNDFRRGTLRENCEITEDDDCFDDDLDAEGDPLDAKCASEPAITNWLADKVLYTKVMNP